MITFPPRKNMRFMTTLGPTLGMMLGLLLSTAVITPLDSYAAEEKKGEKAPAPSIDAATGKILTEAIDALNAEQYTVAAAVIARLSMDKLSPYERGRVEQILATIADSQENYPSAQAHLQAAVDSGGLNEQEISQARYQIAQLYLAQEKWKEGAAAMEAWISTATKPNSSAYYLLAVAYYQQELYKQALGPAQKAVDLAEKPQESWIQLVLALHLQEEHWTQAVPLLVRLINMHPDKKSYWVQLSSVYGQMEKYPQALATMQLAYDNGLIVDNGEILRLVDLLLFNNVPYRCGTILEESIAKKTVKIDTKLYQKQSDCWIAAREYEKAIGPLGKAAKLSSNGDLFVRLGEVQIQRNEWSAASDAISQGLNKGNLKDTSYAQLMLGIALFNQKKLTQAADYFQKAKSSGKQRKTAEGYLQLIKAQAR
ncbi:MAG: tetratricopeptide repeat protein [Xanthomonadales bacterium]|nr:tetratricopeptide repeat protein [Xanthomonadales bacterium]